MNSAVKNIGKKLIGGTIEVVKDSAEQIGKTVSPEKLVGQALGTAPKKPNEMTEYLRSLGPDASPEDLKRREEELSEKEKEEAEEARRTIRAAVPAHMRPAPKPPELRSYEKMQREAQEAEAQRVEAQKKQQQQQLNMPSGVEPRGSLFAKKKKGSSTPMLSSSEGLKKDRKIG